MEFIQYEVPRGAPAVHCEYFYAVVGDCRLHVIVGKDENFVRELHVSISIQKDDKAFVRKPTREEIELVANAWFADPSRTRRFWGKDNSVFHIIGTY